MIENKDFPAYRLDDPSLAQKRVSLMLTYEQILMVASSLALLQEYNAKGPLARLFFSPPIAQSELALQTSVHNACINCALSLEEYHKSRGIHEK